MILDTLPLDVFFASSSSFAAFATLRRKSGEHISVRETGGNSLFALAGHLAFELRTTRKLAIGLASVAAFVEVLLSDGVEDRAKFSWMDLINTQ
jgi:hypothetical protein